MFGKPLVMKGNTLGNKAEGKFVSLCRPFEGTASGEQAFVFVKPNGRKGFRKSGGWVFGWIPHILEHKLAHCACAVCQYGQVTLADRDGRFREWR